jgi:ketosteroid isomerase-like protein
MSQRSVMALASVVLLGAACRPATVDTAAEAEQLLATDRAWAEVAAAGTDVDSIVSFWTDDARVVSADQPTIQGTAALREMVQAFATIPGAGVTWTPETAVVAASGDLGYTYGTNAFTVPDSAGTATTMRGRYITVWRKNADGRWRCVMDFSTPGTGEAAAQ